MTREEAARAFAEKMRPFPQATMDKTCDQCGHSIHATCHAIFHNCPNCYFAIAELPAPDAPLHEHLAFVGRVAEAIGPLDRVDALGSCNRFHCCGCTGAQWWVKFYERSGRVGLEYSARDLSHAALLAALAALEAR